MRPASKVSIKPGQAHRPLLPLDSVEVASLAMVASVVSTSSVRLFMKRNRTYCAGLFCLLLLSGCTYKGQLKTGFYTPIQNAPKIPLKAAIVIGPAFESGTFDTKGVYYAHSAQIRTHPALTQAMTDSCRSVFASVSVVQFVPASSPDVEVLIIPSVEMRERVLTLSVALKSPTSGDLIQQYQSSGNLTVRAPASVHVIGTINTVCMAALSDRKSVV